MRKAVAGSDRTPLKLGNTEVACYVLDDGTRVLSGRAMQKAIGYEGSSGDWLKNFVQQKNIAPALPESVVAGIMQPIEFERNDAGGSQPKTYGYEATRLIDLCDAILDLKKAGVLKPNQEIYAVQAEIIIRAVAKVGIIALVDEVTGYQYDREKNELQKILKSYISEALLPWQKKFPDVFYKELFRLNGWDYTVNGIKKRPGVIGTWTNKLIYEQLPPGVLEELKEKTPKSDAGNYTARFFQSLTPDTGNPHLTAQIQQIITLFQLSDSMKHMWDQFEKLKIRQSSQLELPFRFDDKGHTIEPKYEKETLSDHNQKLKQALNYDPKKKEGDE